MCIRDRSAPMAGRSACGCTLTHRNLPHFSSTGRSQTEKSCSDQAIRHRTVDVYKRQPLISAIFAITYGIFRESLRVPRCGSGAIYGQSAVSYTHLVCIRDRLIAFVFALPDQINSHRQCLQRFFLCHCKMCISDRSRALSDPLLKFPTRQICLP